MNRGTMTIDAELSAERPVLGARAIGTTILAFGGLAAAFGAAACCALPVGLGVLGLGSAWLIGVASIAAPYRSLLLGLALTCVALGLVLTYRNRPAASCSSGACTTWISRGTKSGLWMASALVGAALVLG
jgi:mercuric ion transport protein